MKCILRHSFAKRSAFVLVLIVLTSACRHARAEATVFDACGTLHLGIACPVILVVQREDGEDYYGLSTIGDFNNGDYVRVVGSAYTYPGPSPCYMTQVVVTVHTISWCNTPVEHTTWGKIKALYE